MGAVRVVELMKAADATIAEAGAKALRSIALPYSGKDEVFEAGGIDALMEVMALHKTHEGVCEAVSDALGRITKFGITDKKGMLQALPLLLECFSIHKTNICICESVSGVLCNLVNVYEALTRGVLDTGAVQVLVEILEIHKDHKAICSSASSALYGIVIGSAERKASVVRAGAVPLLAAVYKTHSGSARVHARDALDSLGFKYDGSKKY